MIQMLKNLEAFSASWFGWMAEMSLQLAVLAGVLTLLTWVLRRRSAVFLHALWMLVLIRMVVPPGFAAPTGWAWWVRAPQKATALEDPASNTVTARPKREIGP